mgnify:FL=1
MTFDDELGSGRTHNSGLFEALVKDIYQITENVSARERLKVAVGDNLSTYIRCWERDGVSQVKLAMVIPAHNSVNDESVDQYEKLVYGAAEGILRDKGFVLEGNHWLYRPKS